MTYLAIYLLIGLCIGLCTPEPPDDYYTGNKHIVSPRKTIPWICSTILIILAWPLVALCVLLYAFGGGLD